MHISFSCFILVHFLRFIAFCSHLFSCLFILFLFLFFLISILSLFQYHAFLVYVPSLFYFHFLVLSHPCFVFCSPVLCIFNPLWFSHVPYLSLARLNLPVNSLTLGRTFPVYPTMHNVPSSSRLTVGNSSTRIPIFTSF